jgi:hypothetical protein
VIHSARSRSTCATVWQIRSAISLSRPFFGGQIRKIRPYGVMTYQEQVMQIAQVLAGYSLGGADLLRRAMGKKIASDREFKEFAAVAFNSFEHGPERRCELL